MSGTKFRAPVNGKTVTGYVFAEYIDLTGDTSSSGEGDSSSDISFTDDEVELLAALVYCEAGNQSYEGKLAVANVVLNRLNQLSVPEYDQRRYLSEKSVFTGFLRRFRESAE